MTYNKIILLGFRCTGKSYAGRILAEKIGWELADMDTEIVKRTGKSVAEISNYGKDWTRFRELELELLRELLQKENIIIGAGGGVGVNSTKMPNKIKTFGQAEANLLKRTRGLLKILIIADKEIIKKRLIACEMKERGSRPILDSALAKSDKHKSLKTLIDSNMKVLDERKEKYENLGDIVINNTNRKVNLKNIIDIIQNARK